MKVKQLFTSLLLFVSLTITAKESANILKGAESTETDKKVTLEFNYKPDRKTKYLCLEKSSKISHKMLKLNKKSIPVPMDEMYYSKITGIPANLLKKGKNTLVVTLGEKAKASDVTKMILSKMSNKQFSFVAVPCIGDASAKSLRISCRVNIPAKVELKINGKKLKSKEGFLHSFKVTGLKKGTTYPYKLTATLDRKSISTKTYKVKTYDPDNMVFGILGDSRGKAERWGKVADAMATANPQFVIHTGDMVTTGYIDDQWVDEFCKGGENVFPTTPYYLVNGNHDKRSSWQTKIFSTPSGNLEWSQRIGKVLIIGNPSEKFLKEKLSKTDAEFIFVATHSPAWSSGPHGSSKSSQKLLAIMEKYNATAMFSGHDHAYERSEPDGGVSVIVSGGAGAPLYGAKGKKNPHSKIFLKKYHYCVLKVKGDVCTLTAKDIDGNVIDSHAWKARSAKK